ncbi:MAG: TetR/AcrR family transcriptional regulator C-terminal domain-containing protein [Bacillota bacterium]|nr:TetR/AcrR family transcriptional regulator C-terminal domain-containing protein [Bacillota bacterium]
MKNEETLLLFARAIKSLIKTQPLDKITVTDIVSQAGKTRQTFYRHFQDKYDLVNWYFEKLVLKSFEEMRQGGSLQEALNLKFAFIEQEHAFFKEAFKSNDYNNLVHYDFCCIYDFYKKFIYKKTGKDLPKDIDFLLNMYCRGSVDMTVDWVLNDMPIKKEEIVQYLIEAIPDKLEAYMI